MREKGLARKEPGIFMRAAVVLCGAVLGGMLWRIRGDGGFGAMWGMLTVAAGLSLFVFSVFGARKKIAYGLFPLTVAFTGLTAGGWGTLWQQLGGRLSASVPFAGEAAARIVEVRAWSGLFVMLALGFGWMPLFAFFMGYYFSGRRYRFWELAAGIAVFYALMFACKASLAHPLVTALCPDATQLFRAGLADASVDASPFLAYLRHFNSAAWAKTIPGGRNYFASIAAVAAALGAVGLFFYQRFALRDKKAARVTLALNAVVAVSLSLPAALITAEGPGALLHLPRLVALLQQTNWWSVWEYSSGFLIGLGLMLVCFWAEKRAEKEERNIPEAFPALPAGAGKVYGVVFSLYAPLALTLIRPLAGKLGGENNALNYGLIAVFSAAALAVCALASKRILPRTSPEPFAGLPFRTFCARALAVYFVSVSLIYFLAGESAPLPHPADKPTLALMLASFAVVAVLLVRLRRVNAYKQ